MSASIVSNITHMLRNAFTVHHLPSLTRTIAKPIASPWQPCFQVRTCTDQPKVNEQKRMLKWSVNRDWNNRKLVKQYGAQRQRLNAIRQNKILPQEIKDLASMELHALPRRSSLSYTFPRCVLTGKARGRVKRWRLSRIQWRLFADYNNLSGVTRAMW